MSVTKAKIQTLRKSKSEEDRRACLVLLRDYLVQNPKDAEAWYDKACCHDFIGEEREAEPCYRSCYELGWQKLPEAEQKSFFVGYGSTLRNNLKYGESISLLKDGIKHFPGYAPLKIFLAFSHYSEGQDRLAAEILFAGFIEAAAGGLDGYERAIQYYVDHLRDHPEARAGDEAMKPGQVHHIEYYVKDLQRSNEFWSWFLPELGYIKLSEFNGGISWAHQNGTYLVFVQVAPEHLAQNNNRQGSGLNHIAFQGKSREQVLGLKEALKARGIRITFEDDSQICFEDPNDFAVEVYVPADAVNACQ